MKDVIKGRRLAFLLHYYFPRVILFWRAERRFRDDEVLGGGVLAVGETETKAEETNEIGGGGEAAIGGLNQVAKHDEAGPLRG